MDIRQQFFTGACLIALSAAALGSGPAQAEDDAQQARQAPQVRQVPVQRAQRMRLAPPAPEQTEKLQRFILTLSDRQVGGQVVVSGDVEEVKAASARNNAAQERASGALRSSGLSEIKPIRGSRFTAASGTLRQVQALQRSGVIAAFEEDQLLTPMLQHSVAAINPPPGWSSFNRGKGRIIAIIDTGVLSTHAFLAGRLAAEACFSTTSASIGTAAVCTSGSTAPGSGAPCIMAGCNHGTHVAGVAVGRANSSTAMNGVAPDAKYVAIQTASNYGGSPAALSSDTLASFYHVRDLKTSGINISSVNYSLGGAAISGPCGGPMETIFQQLRALNVAPVTSSGNQGLQGSVSYPACAPSAITVAASNNQDVMASFSNLSPMVDLVAPGVSVVSANSAGNSSYFGAGGTSVSSPHVAGAFALLRQVYHCYSIDQLEAALKNSGTMIAGPGSTGSFPRIDLAATYTSLGQFRIRSCPVIRVNKAARSEAMQAEPF